MKVCRKCKEEKPLTEFYASQKAADGRYTYCKVCTRAMGKEWRAANIERARVREAAWRATNPEKVSAYHAKWRAENPEEVNARAKTWQAANPEKLKVIREKHRAKKRAAHAAWLEANKDAITKPIKTPEEWSQ